MFCINYYPNQRYMQEADELKIKYKPTDRTLRDFIEKYIEKTISIDISDNFTETDAELFKSLYRVYKNFKLIVDYNNTEYLQRIRKYELPFFFSNFVTTIDQLHGLMKYHPTDMYICEELGFSLDKIGPLLHNNNIKVRVIPNLCQSSFPETPSIKTFFVRPEDISIYSNFVDVFELFSDPARQRIIFKIYKQEKWFGPIRELIPSFKDDLDSRYLVSSFGLIRCKCGKRCMYRPTSCDICNRFSELAKTFKENNIMIKKVKKTDTIRDRIKELEEEKKQQEKEISEARKAVAAAKSNSQPSTPQPKTPIPPHKETQAERDYRLAMEADEGYIDDVPR